MINTNKTYYLAIHQTLLFAAFFLISCATHNFHFSFENRTLDTIEVLIDTIYILKLEPQSNEKIHVALWHPMTYIIESPKIGQIKLGSIMDSVVDNRTYFHYYNVVGRKNDSIVFHYTFSHIESPQLNDTVFVIK